MGSGRVISAEPKSLRRICFFDENTDEFLKKLHPSEQDIQEFFGKIDELPDPEQEQEPNPTKKMITSNYPFEYPKLVKLIHNNAMNSVQKAEKIIAALMRGMLNNANNLATEHGQCIIEENNNDLTKIAFKNQDNEVAHIDGVLVDGESGRLLYYIATSDSETVAENFDKIEEASKVHYQCEYAGACEVILHKREEHKKIIGDVKLEDEDVVVLRFVMVDQVEEAIQYTPFATYTLPQISANGNSNVASQAKGVSQTRG